VQRQVGHIVQGEGLDAQQAAQHLELFLRTEALVNAERAQQIMAREQLDAFVVTQPTNVFYLANHWPNLDRMGFRHSMFVIYPRDPKRPVAMVMTGFLHYYRYADDVDLPNRIVFPYTSPVPPLKYQSLRHGFPGVFTTIARVRGESAISSSPSGSAKPGSRSVT
jgi:hypothetical protein